MCTIVTDGLVGLYRGFYFGLYDTFQPLLGEDTGFLISLPFAVIAGLLSLTGVTKDYTFTHISGTSPHR
jgi:hypothetical protein